MAKNVRFVQTTKQKWLDRETYDPYALYFCTDTGEIFKGNVLFTEGVKVIPTRDDLPSFECAADGVVYFIAETKSGFMISPDRTEWLQTIYAPVTDAYTIPEEEMYTTVTTVGAVRDIEAKIYERIDSIEIGAGGANPAVYVTHKYEIFSKPQGTLVDYRDKEIRVMCPTDTEWIRQTSGDDADPNSYYIGFKAYAPNGATGFKEDLSQNITDNTMYYFENNDFAGIDEYGRCFSIVWLPAAKLENDAWIYYGATSTKDKYVGWYYSVEWYDGDNRLVGSDCIKINLSNEECHSLVEPYYIADIIKQVDDKIIATNERQEATNDDILNLFN
jgi:hypothetical protein